VAQYDVNLEIGGTNVAQNDNYPHTNSEPNLVNVFVQSSSRFHSGSGTTTKSRFTSEKKVT
jgi:hypothetical protein